MINIQQNKGTFAHVQKEIKFGNNVV